VGKRGIEPRLLAIAGLIEPGMRVADIGAGDGRLARLLRLRGHPVIATDISPHAVRQMRDTLLPLGVDVRAGDGFQPIGPGEVDTVVAAGIGGHTIARWLEQSPHWVARRLVLQPMRHADTVLETLRARGAPVTTVATVWSRGRPYVIVVAEPTTAGTAASEQDVGRG
jgi:tRNA (adenine22-N1)-methyltransferase